MDVDNVEGFVEGFLEVGCNEQNQIVVNHPDLEPDENGVGHIVFSVNQARGLADSLLRKAFEAEKAIRAAQESEGECHIMINAALCKLIDDAGGVITISVEELFREATMGTLALSMSDDDKVLTLTRLKVDIDKVMDSILDEAISQEVHKLFIADEEEER